MGNEATPPPAREVQAATPVAVLVEQAHSLHFSLAFLFLAAVTPLAGDHGSCPVHAVALLARRCTPQCTAHTNELSHGGGSASRPTWPVEHFARHGVLWIVGNVVIRHHHNMVLLVTPIAQNLVGMVHIGLVPVVAPAS